MDDQKPRTIAPLNPYDASSATDQDVATKSLKPPVGLIAASLYGLAAAVLYTASNIALRGSVDVDPFLVSAVKAVPTVMALAPVLVWMLLTQRTIATNRKLIPRFILVSLVSQFLGNAAFQVALGIIGLAAAVPITLGTLIIGGAVLARIMLGEPVRARTIIAMITLITAVVVLSLPRSPVVPSGSVLGDSILAESISGDLSSEWPLWTGGLCAAVAGGTYALFGVVVRQILTRGLSAPATMFISGTVGTISLWSYCFVVLGLDAIAAIPANLWWIMFAAGAFNFAAFVALSVSLKALPVVAVNLINASQVAMAAVAGVILFSEPVTWPLLTGIALTFAGLAVLASRRR